MRQILATVTGVLVTGLSLNLIRWFAATYGVVPEVPLSYPVERSYGRYFSEPAESTDTLFGMASFFSTAYLGLTAGYIVHRARPQPWRTLYERATALGWATFLGFTLAYSAVVQVVFGVHARSSWSQNFLIDIITYGVPAIVGWRLWHW